MAGKRNPRCSFFGERSMIDGMRESPPRSSAEQPGRFDRARAEAKKWLKVGLVAGCALLAPRTIHAQERASSGVAAVEVGSREEAVEQWMSRLLEENTLPESEQEGIN